MDKNEAIQALQSEETELKREVSLFGGISVLAGIMVGSGIFYIGSYVLLRAGMSIGLSLLIWIIGGVVTMISGICYAELGAMMPKAGGQYVYLREAYGERLAFMSGFAAFLLGNTGSISALAVAFASGVVSAVGGGDLAVKLLAVAMIVLLTFLNIRGVKIGEMIQKTFLIGKIIPIAIIIILGLTVSNQHTGFTFMSPEMAQYSPGKILVMIAYATLATLWAYEGWTNLNVISEEIKNPKRNIPLAIILSIAGVMIIYFLFHLAIFSVVSPDVIAESIHNDNYYIGTIAAEKILGSWGGKLVFIGMLLAIFGSLNGCVMAFPRTYYAMAKDGLFFKSFGTVNPKYRTPDKALIASMLVAIVLVFMRNLDGLTSLVIFSGNMFNAMTFASVLTLRKKYPDMHRPYKVWGGKFTIYLAIFLMIGMAVVTMIEDPVSSLLGLIIPVIGAVIYEISRRKKEA